jgi:hypothetical protein
MSGPEPEAVTEPSPLGGSRLVAAGRPAPPGAAAGRPGGVALWCSVLGWCLAFPAPVGLGLGALIWLMARRDVPLMDAGVMDPAGREGRVF